jgi:hypothetical protein
MCSEVVLVVFRTLGPRIVNAARFDVCDVDRVTGLVTSCYLITDLKFNFRT